MIEVFPSSTPKILMKLMYILFDLNLIIQGFFKNHEICQEIF